MITRKKKAPSLTYAYMRDVNKFPSGRRSDEKALILLAQRGSIKARDKVIHCHLKFVVRVALMYQNKGVPVSDLIGEGNHGLIDAIKNFNINKNVHFISYAVWWIRHHIQICIFQKNKNVRPRSDFAALSRRFYVALDKLHQSLNREPEIHEIMEYTGFRQGQVEDFISATKYEVRLDKPIADDDGATVMSSFSNDSVTGEAMEAESSKEGLLKKIKSLVTEREYVVIVRYFGLKGDEPDTLKDMGDKVNLSKERIRQIKTKGLNKLKKNSSLFRMILQE